MEMVDRAKKPEGLKETCNPGKTQSTENQNIVSENNYKSA